MSVVNSFTTDNRSLLPKAVDELANEPNRAFNPVTSLGAKPIINNTRKSICETEEITEQNRFYRYLHLTKLIHSIVEHRN